MKKTIKQCECGGPYRWIKDTESPIIFDEKFGEYRIEYKKGEGKNALSMYFCFSCGGRLPKSNRELFFSVPSKWEQIRLKIRLLGCMSPDAIISRLGNADFDFKTPEEIRQRILKDLKDYHGVADTLPTRQIRWTKIAKSFDYQIDIFEDRHFEAYVTRKYLDEMRRTL